MKQAEVVFEELENGNIKVVDFKNIAKIDEIKYDEYLKMYPSMFVDREGCFRIYIKQRTVWWLSHVDVEITMTKSLFNNLIKIMKQCGENYAKAKKVAMSKARVVKSIKI
jgi:hypothetical protein